MDKVVHATRIALKQNICFQQSLVMLCLSRENAVMVPETRYVRLLYCKEHSVCSSSIIGRKMCVVSPLEQLQLKPVIESGACMHRLCVGIYKPADRMCMNDLQYEKNCIDPRAGKKLLKNNSVCCLLISIPFHQYSQECSQFIKVMSPAHVFQKGKQS